ncbi:MAG: hypothetical protein JNM84_27190 [Planctomycetes bacterium]|nr:hypothetical protein [Planctomycetota bacterium]
MKLVGEELVSFSLSFALWPIDPVTGRVVPHALDARIAALQRSATRNGSGHCCFVDLPLGAHRVTITPARGFEGAFLPQELTVVLPMPLGTPVVEFTLFPSPSYAFPPGATLVLGQVRDAVGAPLEGALLEVDARPERGRSSRNGAFALALDTTSDLLAATLRASASSGASGAVVLDLLHGQRTNVGVLSIS